MEFVLQLIQLPTLVVVEQILRVFCGHQLTTDYLMLESGRDIFYHVPCVGWSIHLLDGDNMEIFVHCNS